MNRSGRACGKCALTAARWRSRSFPASCPGYYPSLTRRSRSAVTRTIPLASRSRHTEFTQKLHSASRHAVAMTENNHADAPPPERPAEVPLQSGQPASQTPWSDRTSEAAYSSPAQPPSSDQPAYAQEAGYSSTSDYPSSSTSDYSSSEPGRPYGGYQQPSFHTEPLPPSSPAFGPYAPRATKPPKQRQMRTIFVAAVTAALVGAGVGAGTVALVDDNNSNSTVASSV